MPLRNTSLHDDGHRLACAAAVLHLRFQSDADRPVLENALVALGKTRPDDTRCGALIGLCALDPSRRRSITRGFAEKFGGTDCPGHAAPDTRPCLARVTAFLRTDAGRAA